MIKKSNDTMPDPSDGTRCDSPLGGFTGSIWLDSGRLTFSTMPEADNDILNHDDAGDGCVYPTFDLGAVIDDFIEFTSGSDGMLRDEHRALYDLCARIIAKLDTLTPVEE